MVMQLHTKDIQKIMSEMKTMRKKISLGCGKDLSLDQKNGESLINF